jgi:hypothetical protein
MTAIMSLWLDFVTFQASNAVFLKHHGVLLSS